MQGDAMKKAKRAKRTREPIIPFLSSNLRNLNQRDMQGSSDLFLKRRVMYNRGWCKGNKKEANLSSLTGQSVH